MKEISINDVTYEIKANALTYVIHKNVFNNGIFTDINIVRRYMLKQLEIVEKLSNNNQAEDIEEDNISDFIVSIMKLAYSLIKTANKSFMSYEEWIETFIPNLQDKWIVEVAQYAVECFR